MQIVAICQKGQFRDNFLEDEFDSTYDGTDEVPKKQCEQK